MAKRLNTISKVLKACGACARGRKPFTKLPNNPAGRQAAIRLALRSEEGIAWLFTRIPEELLVELVPPLASAVSASRYRVCPLARRLQSCRLCARIQANLVPRRSSAGERAVATAEIYKLLLRERCTF